MSEGKHPWQQVDRRLAEMKIGEAGDKLVDSLRKRLADAARTAAEEGRGRISTSTISSVVRSIDPLLEIAYRAYREVWTLQGYVESPEFIRTIYEYVIKPRIVCYIGWVRYELGKSIDPVHPDREQSRLLLEDTEVEAEKIRREWGRKCEIDAKGIEYKSISKTPKSDKDSESRTVAASIEPLSKRPGKKPNKFPLLKSESSVGSY